jgi:hypothetical protein
MNKAMRFFRLQRASRRQTIRAYAKVGSSKTPRWGAGTTSCVGPSEVRRRPTKTNPELNKSHGIRLKGWRIAGGFFNFSIASHRVWQLWLSTRRLSQCALVTGPEFVCAPFVDEGGETGETTFFTTLSPVCACTTARCRRTRSVSARPPHRPRPSDGLCRGAISTRCVGNLL